MASRLSRPRTNIKNETMDFTLTPELAELKGRIKRFIADEIIPFETDPRQGAHGPDDAVCTALVDKAHRAGLLSPQPRTSTAGWACCTSAVRWHSRKPAIRCSARWR